MLTLAEAVLYAIAILATLSLVLAWWVARLRRSLRDADTRKRRQSANYGRITEQFAPFLDAYPYDARGFRFLGSPVDGVHFGDDEIVFVEFKAAESRLSPEQERIRELVRRGRVRWLEFRMD